MCHKKAVLLLIIIVISCIFVSCDSKMGSLPASSGKTAEVLFICDKEYWEGNVGDSIKSIFRAEYKVLNQPEPLFSLAQIEERAFSKIFESHRNIIIVDIKAENQKQKFELRKNVWAQPQLVFKLYAKDKADFIELLNKQKNQIIEYLYENERVRMQKAFKREENIKVINDLKERYGFSFIIPKGYFVATQTGDFCWIRRETDETSIGVLYYTYPYIDTLSFEESNIINLRDSITKMHIPGPRDGSYMQVSRKVVMPVSREISFNGLYAIETKGLWEVEGDFMGGPFVNFTFVDNNKNTVVTIDGFVYAPRFEKRDYMIQVESILYSYSTNK